MEIWNNVFSQFNNDGHGNYTELASKNIDTGMGLERLACVMQGVDSMFEVDTIKNIITAISEKAGIKYHDDQKADISLRIIADHSRASAFLIADGVMPSNEGRGYVLRRLLRRACRHGKLLGIKGAFLSDIIKVVAHENLSAYPELTEKFDYISKIASMEEERFDANVEAGMNLLDALTEKANASGAKMLDGADVFKLSDTYGFPIDLTREIAAERGLGIDEDGYKKCLDEQKARARAARGNISGWQDKSLFSEFEKTVFTGYEKITDESEIIAIVDPDTHEPTDVSGENAVIITKSTCFYGEGGGQVGDTGTIESENGTATVTDTKKADGVYLHICHVESGSFSAGDKVTLNVDGERRAATARNHSAVHLLDAALRKVLGDHIRQAGSMVDAERGRFDFTHFSAVTADELDKVERIINEKILENIPVTTVETDLESAKKSGAIALFGEKYGDTVRVVKMGDFSSELCGGTHVFATGSLGCVRLVSESSVAAGTRRIELISGMGAYALAKSDSATVKSALSALKISEEGEIAAKISALQSDIKQAKKDIEAMSIKAASAGVAEMLAKAETVGAIKVASMQTSLPVDTVRSLSDDIKANHPDTVAVISTDCGGKYSLVCVCGKDALAAGVKAPLVLKELSSFVGGGGGGRPDSAMAGGMKYPEKLGEAFAALPEIIKKLI